MKFTFFLISFTIISCKGLTPISEVPQTLTMNQVNDTLRGQRFPDLAVAVNNSVSAPKAECSAYEPDSSSVSFFSDRSRQNLQQEPLIKNDPSVYPFGSPLEGALRVLASKYQTCKILDNIGGTPQFLARSPDVLTNWMSFRPPLYPSDKKNCSDSTKLRKKMACPVLRHDYCEEVKTGPLDYSQGWRQAQIKNNTMMVQEAASDCSSFISSAMMASGLKMTVNSTKQDYSATTASINEDYHSKKSCFERRKVSDIRNLISPGDILNDSGGGHVVMIDYVGHDDPLGVEVIYDKLALGKLTKYQALAQCEQIELANMKIGIIHSSGSSSGNGIMRERANVIESGVVTKILVGHARGACAHFVSNYPAQGYYDSADGLCETCTILKHKGKKEPACVLDQRPKIQGEECIEDCIQNHI